MNEIDTRQEYAEHFKHQCSLMQKAFENRRINFHPIFQLGGGKSVY